MCVVDIRECHIGTHNCSQLCIELGGGYQCSCTDGYELQDDNTTCEGKYVKKLWLDGLLAYVHTLKIDVSDNIINWKQSWVCS